MRRCYLALVLILTARAFAQVKVPPECTVEDSKRAFDAVDRLKSWGAVRKFYKEYLPCDDGGIAEGVSDSVTQLLAGKWEEFWRLQAATAGDKRFQGFVLNHIDATVSIESLQAISRNARRRCPKRHPEVCKKIDAAALAAIKESQQ